MSRHINGVDHEDTHFSRSEFWKQDSPETLVDNCLSFIVNHILDVLFIEDKETAGYWLIRDIYLPPFLFEELHKKSLEMCRPIPQELLVECLKEHQRFPVRKLNLGQYDDLHESHLKVILCSQLSYLHLNSEHLHQSSVEDVCRLSPSLVTFKVGRNCKISAQDLPHFKMDKLKRLSLNHPSFSTFLRTDLSSFSSQLTVLDLSDCGTTFDLEIDLTIFGSLEWLSLHNVVINDICSTLESLSGLKKLRRLDLGWSEKSEPVIYLGDLVSAMKNLMTNLVHIRWLEICGTNLAASTIDTRSFYERMKNNSNMKIQPIEWLEDRRLEYLGLLNCSGQPCSLDDLPADKVSGDFDVEQILTSMESYLDRHQLLLITLNTLFDWIRSEDQFTETQEARALEYILRALDRHGNARDIQLSGSASIFYLIKGSLKSRLTMRIKRHIIRVTLDAMDKTFANPEESSMCRNGCLILCHFRIPQDLIHDYKRVVSLLLRLIEKPEPRTGEPFIQRVSLNLLNSLACQVDNPEKLMVGKLGTFEVMLKLIRKKLEMNICDEVMEVAWSLMWNATDETAPNCERFITNGGLVMFTSCYEVFKNKGELLRNMMGLMGNVAEVDHLKHHLITSDFIPTFRDLLVSESDGIEVSYNSCGILANLMLKGPSSWGELESYWSSVQDEMRQAMARWPITSERNINYRSFGPILRLLDCMVVEVQQWALWALCNLTKVYRSKYCPLLKEENGVDKLVEVFIRTRSTLIRKMSAKVIRRCNRFEIHPEEVSDTEDEDVGSDLKDGDLDFSIDAEVSGCHEGKGFNHFSEESFVDSCSGDDELGRINLRSIYQRYFHDVDEKKRILNVMLKAMKK